MSQSSKALDIVERILERNLAPSRRRLDIQRTPIGYQINEVLADGSLKPLADTPDTEEVLCLARSPKHVTALIATIAALSVRLDAEAGPVWPSIDALAGVARERRPRTLWRQVDWQSTEPPFDDVTAFATPRRHRRVMSEWRRTGRAPVGYQQCALPDQGTLTPQDWGYRLNEVDWTGFDH